MSNLRWKCDQQGCYAEQLPDWGIFNGRLPRGIRFTDVDGEVEIGGRFLRIEWKRPNAMLPIGQVRAFQAAAETGYFTIVVVWGETNPMRPEYWRLFDDVADSGRNPVTLEELQRFVSVWGATADAGSRSTITS